jgi:hypothetical protein
MLDAVHSVLRNEDLPCAPSTALAFHAIETQLDFPGDGLHGVLCSLKPGQPLVAHTLPQDHDPRPWSTCSSFAELATERVQLEMLTNHPRCALIARMWRHPASRKLNSPER